MLIQDKMRKPMLEAKYLNVENTDRYRPIMRLFYLQYEKLKYWMYQEEVYEELKENPEFSDYTMEQCQQDLTALKEWGNLLTIQDTRKVTSIEEFKSRKFRYQLSEISVEIERMVLRIENLFIEGSSLEPSLLERIRAALEKTEKIAGEEAGKVHGWWDGLTTDFVRLNQNYQDYLRDFYSGKADRLMKSVEFVLHKDKFIKYLNEFIQELQRHSRRISQLLEKHMERMEGTILERVVQSELDIPHAVSEYRGNAEPSIRENVTGKWESLKNWFLDTPEHECEARKVLQITNDVIRSIIQNAALIVQMQNWGISRKEDYRKFLELFLKCEDLEEAHRLSAHVFGIQKMEHFRTNEPRESDAVGKSVYEEAPAEFLLKPHTRAYREKKDRHGFADKSLEKLMQRQQYLQLAERQREVVFRYIRDNRIAFAEIEETVSEATKNMFLQWISLANMNTEGKGRTEYGQEYRLIRQEGSCVLKCEDGNLTMPAYIMEFQ